MKKSLDSKLISLILFGVFLAIGIDAYFGGPLFRLFENVSFYFPAVFSILADWWFILLVCVGMVGVLFYQGRKEEMYLFIGAILLGEILKGGFKLLFHIQRPIEGLITYSYPSGHAFSALLVSLFLWKFFFPKKQFLFAALLISLLVGLSRIGIGAHWMLDVVGGYLLAASLFFFILWFSNTPKYRQFARMDELKYS